MIEPELGEYLPLLLFAAGAIGFASVGLFVARLLAPRKPNYEKLQPYECGEEAGGNITGTFSVKFYVAALVFILFDAELVFMFPWARIFADAEMQQQTGHAWGRLMFCEMLVFIGLLALGLVWAIVKGYLDWLRPVATSTRVISQVPENIYAAFNKGITEHEKRAKAVNKVS